METFGELIAVAVAFSWTLTALFFEYAGRRIGTLPVNLLRLAFAAVLLGGLLFFTTGNPLPTSADSQTWIWMALSGVVGFVFGDFCLFYSYILISARFSQLIMTLAPPFAAFFGWLILDERMSPMGYLGMAVTLTGIAISILKRSNTDENGGAGRKLKLQLSTRGLLFALGGALGQGLGIVLSKKGMDYYQISAAGTSTADYIPFAATQIRILTGIIGFGAIILLTGRLQNFKIALKNGKGMAATFGGSIFGPFLGVSLSLLAIQYANVSVASTIMATVPVIILLPHILIYKKRVTAAEAIGAGVSVAGVALFFI